MMRILVVHNNYADHIVGGEAMVMHAEADLLRSRGHEVQLYERDNSEIQEKGVCGRIGAFLHVGWSLESYQAVARVVEEFKPDLMHVHNYRFLLTPSVLAAAKDRGVATVLTLHNYRLACPAGQFMRNGRACEDCLDGFPYRMLWRRCVPNPLKSVAQLYLYQSTRQRDLLAPWVDVYIALTAFGVHKFIDGGVPSAKLTVKPNFMADPLHGRAPEGNGYGAVFIGRLFPEKGVKTLMHAWQLIDYPLTIVGDGPLLKEMRAIATPNVRFMGQKEHSDCLRLMSEAAFTVFPSEWYEGFPLSLLESMAVGRAVVASDMGPRRELVKDGATGVLFEAASPDDLRQKALWLIDHPLECKEMGRRAREAYLESYTPEKNYQQLINIYERAIESNKGTVQARSK